MIKYPLVCIFFFFSSVAQAGLLSVYLTWQGEETHNNQTINYITDKKISGEVYYSSLNSQEPSLKASGERVRLPGRLGYLHRIELKGLQSNRPYKFWVRLEDGSFSSQFRFKTLPEKGATVRFMQGGDMGTTEDVITTTFVAHERVPDVILIGGDIAYADGEVESFYEWRRWFQLMNEVMTNNKGFLTPLVAALGNHETNDSYQSYKRNAPFYSLLFKSHSDRPFFVKKFSDHTVLFALDSGHTYTHASQVKWLENKLRTHQNIPNLLALYHVPLYPSHRSPYRELSENGRKYWGSLFDKYGLDLAFENHDHTLKRSYMLKENRIVSQGGTLFVGDGCWGRGTREAEQRNYLKISMEANHVWSAAASNGLLQLEASDSSWTYDRFSIDTTRRILLD